MIGKLIAKECGYTVKSLIYLVYVVCVALFFFTQIGNVTFPEKPLPGQEKYEAWGRKISSDKQLIMGDAISNLGLEVSQGQYMTDPIGFTKYVKLDKQEQKQVVKFLEQLTGLTEDEINEMEEAHYENQSIYMPMSLAPAEDLSYEVFLDVMKEIDAMLGGHSSYRTENIERGVPVPMTYEEAAKAYEKLIKTEQVTGGYARLFSDYMGIILALAPIFLIVTRGVRDKRAQMQELIYTRRGTSMQIVLSRYISVVLMSMLPIVILSFITLAECIAFANGIGVSVDYFAFLKYIGGWLLPECMIVVAMGIFLTEWTQSVLAILVQVLWWFLDISMGVSAIYGKEYGMHLIARHNTTWNYDGFLEGFPVIMKNRIIYAILACGLVAVTVWVYEQKRKGRLRNHGKISANWKRKFKA